MTAADNATGPAVDGEWLMAEVRALLGELHGARSAPPDAGLDSHFDRDLGLDSLSRMELVARLERAAGRTLPERALAEALTPRDLLVLLERARVDAPASSARRSYASPRAGDPERTAGVSPAPAFETLTAALEWHVAAHPDRVHVHLYGDEADPAPVTYGLLWERSLRVAGALGAVGVGAGQNVAIMLPTGLDYLATFAGILLAGAVPVPVYPPARPSQVEDHLRRHARILDNAQVAALVTFDRARGVSRLLTGMLDRPVAVVVTETLPDLGATHIAASVAPDDLAFIQYTSGSTGTPKGVTLTHRQVTSSLRSMATALGATSEDVFVSWLPLYHDMGLIGAWLGSLYFGFPLVLMSPLAFLARPERWLEAITRHRGTLSGGPNFAYELCVRRVPERAMAGLDLASWRLAFNGAEPVDPGTMDAFCSRFVPAGFDPRAMSPVYGLAEATLGVAFTPRGRGARCVPVDRTVLEREARATAPRGEGSVVHVSSGPAIPGFEVRTVDETGREAPERHVGRVEFRGPGATDGYYRNPDATAALCHGDWRVTGDLGYVSGGELYITGREKDVIIRAGRNLYPYDIESAIAEVEGVRRGCVAVLGVEQGAAATQRLVAIVETRVQQRNAREALLERVRTRAAQAAGQPLDDIVLVPPHVVLKTSSGKIRRTAMAALYREGALGRTGGGLYWQVARVALAGVGPFLRRKARLAGALGFALRFWGVVGVVGAVAWPWVAAARDGSIGFSRLGIAGRCILRFAGLRLAVSGLDHLPDGAAMLVSNHASYLDGLVLAAALPRAVRFVVKAELAGSRVTAPFVDGIGGLYVERFDAARGAADAGELGERLMAGEQLLAFPEGTLHRMPGLLPFQLGAFAAAARAGVPVVPVVLRGTRDVLRDGAWFPRAALVSVEVLPPVVPRGIDWAAAIALRDDARAHMLERCGEPDLSDRNPLGELARLREGAGRG